MTLALQGIAPTACTEHELVAAIRRGDDRAFEALFSRYERRITAYVAGMVGDHARAEDIAQDVFISALRRMRETRRPIAFKPWIYEIAKNACIDEFRRTRRNQEVSLEDGDGSGPGSRSVYVHAPPPQVAIESKQRLDDLCGAFGGLSESHHQVLVLRELEGLSYGEIGERLGMTRAMVESTLFRARRRLSEEYEELASGRRCARVLALIDADGRPLTTLGIRDRRQLTRHLAHCEPCRRRARIGGVDESLIQPRRRIARIAALLPLPLLRWRRGTSSNEAVAQSGSHSLAVAQSLQNVAQLVDPGTASVVLSRAAATAAAIAIAGASGGIVANLGARSGPGALSSVARAPTARLPVLSFTKILAPASISAAATAAGYPFRWPASAPTQTAGGQIPVQAQRSETSAGSVGAVPGGSGGAPGAGTGQPAGGGTVPTSGGSGGSGSGSGAPAGGTGSPSGGGVSVTPSVPSTPSGPATPSAPTTPPPPAPPTDSPSTETPQVSGTPTVQGVQTPTAASAESTVNDTSTTVTQTVTQVQQTVSPPPSTTTSSALPGS